MENFYHRMRSFSSLFCLFFGVGGGRNFKVLQQFLHHNSERGKKVEEEMETSCTMVVNSFVYDPERVNVELSLAQLWWWNLKHGNNCFTFLLPRRFGDSWKLQ